MIGMNNNVDLHRGSKIGGFKIGACEKYFRPRNG